MSRDDNRNDIDKMRIDYFNIEVPQELDGCIESAIRRAKISRKNRYRAPITAIAICAIIMVCLGFIKPHFSTEDGKNPNASIGLKEVKHEQLPVVGSFDELKKLIAVNYQESSYGFKESKSSGMKSMAKADNSNLANDTLKTVKADYSTTNVQVQGVDEGDVVKTDGKYIYKINNNKVVIASGYPAEEMKIVSEIQFNYGDFYPREIFLNGKYMILIGGEEGGCKTMKTIGDCIAPIRNTKAIVFDVSDKSKAKQVRDIALEGGYVSSRIVGSKLYLAANKYIPMFGSLDELDSKECLPHYKDSLGNGELKEIDYNKIQYCPEAIEPSYIMLASLDLNKLDKEVKITTVLGSARNIYVSDKNLYVAGTKYSEEVEKSSIYKFALKDGAMEFIAKGNVPGYILNQFSMDESGKYFRITTTNDMGMLKDGTNDQKNNLYILDENLKIKGKLEGMAQGERIYSTRFIGDRAYMVTFKNTDPLFVIDLKNPESPKVLGELKIPGFSNYLHPYDENHIIGFGKDTEEVVSTDQNGGQVAAWAKTKGMKLAIFDVTDVNSPKQQFVTTIGGRGTYSELLYNHKALIFDKDRELLAFPVDVTKEKEGEACGGLEFQGLYVYNVNLKDGFVLKGKINHADFIDNNEDPIKKNEASWYGDYRVERALYINNVLYTLSNGGIKANSLNDLRELGKIKINN